MLCGRRSPPKLKGAVYEINVRPAMLYGSKVWCLKESEIGILLPDMATMRAMCVGQLKGKNRAKNLMLMMGLNETMDRLAMANNVHWYGHVLRRDDGHVLRGLLDFEVDGQRKKGRPKRTWKKQVDEESVKVGLRREDALCRSKWSVGVNKM